MENSILINEDNIIGCIASTILEFKKVKLNKEINSYENIFNLLNFLKNTNNESYKDLLYDKNFLISENTLIELHNEFKNNEKINSDKIGRLILNIEEIKKNSEIKRKNEIESIDFIMGELKKIIEILLKLKYQKQISLKNG